LSSTLRFNGAWRFNSPGPISQDVSNEFHSLIGRVVAQGERQPLLEHFKTYFAGAAGMVTGWSSSAGWADSDLLKYMEYASENAPLFIEAFYGACEDLRQRGDIHTPDASMINQVLARYQSGYRIQPPDLVTLEGWAPVPVEALLPSLDEQAQNIIHESLRQSQEYLASGNYRQAVGEILWLLETVSTLFQGLAIGDDTVTGKYFNVIADELRHQKGTVMELSMTWAKSLHGYLSSPTGGGVRHGASLREGIAMPENEARLFCNLIRSYITYLLDEHARRSSS
jgi:hypothetical protein